MIKYAASKGPYQAHHSAGKPHPAYTRDKVVKGPNRKIGTNKINQKNKRLTKSRTSNPFRHAVAGQ